MLNQEQFSNALRIARSVMDGSIHPTPTSEGPMIEHNAALRIAQALVQVCDGETLCFVCTEDASVRLPDGHDYCQECATLGVYHGDTGTLAPGLSTLDQPNG